MKNFLPCLICVLLLIGCLPDQQSKQLVAEAKIVQGNIADKTFFIPEGYFQIKAAPFGENSIYLQTMYPDFLPLEKESLEYWREGVWWKNVSILGQYHPNSTLTNNDFAKKQIEFLKAFEIVGEEYGLLHQKQPKEYIQDKKDVWLDKSNGVVSSTIMCSESLIENDFPQCSQNYYLFPKFRLRISFDKRLLKNWEEIDQLVRDLFDSFETPEKAKSFLENRILLAKSELENESKNNVEH